MMRVSTMVVRSCSTPVMATKGAAGTEQTTIAPMKGRGFKSWQARCGMRR
jgi:hypothetical protein